MYFLRNFVLPHIHTVTFCTLCSLIQINYCFLQSLSKGVYERSNTVLLPGQYAKHRVSLQVTPVLLFLKL